MALVRGGSRFTDPVRKHMSTRLDTLAPSASLDDALAILDHGTCRSWPKAGASRAHHPHRHPQQPQAQAPVEKSEEAPKFATRAIHAGQPHDPATGAVITPIYATSTYAQESPGRHKGLDYARTHNPTRFAYERCVADLEGAKSGFAFFVRHGGDGDVLELLSSGAHVVHSTTSTGGTRRLFERVRRRSAGLDFSYTTLASRDELLARSRRRRR